MPEVPRIPVSANRKVIWVACLANNRTVLGPIEAGPHQEGKDYKVSYQFHPDFWDQGYTSEAVAAVVDQALNTKGLTRVIAETQSQNIGSCRLLERLGMLNWGGLKDSVQNRSSTACCRVKKHSRHKFIHLKILHCSQPKYYVANQGPLGGICSAALSKCMNGEFDPFVTN